MPYRQGGRHLGERGTRDAGIVGDVIEQFADRFAFYRELVQNAIDAGTREIHVELGHDPTRQQMLVSVEDQGEGMDRDVIENRLLVLFRSTKEDDPDKIGKFGIGFASVLAMRPELIRVTSVQGGSRHILQLYSDLSYELFEGGPATRTGTKVELEVPIAHDGVEDFARQSLAALRSWCRHATTPIYFRNLIAGSGDAVRIDGPLAIDGALVEVQGTSSDGKTKVVVALTAEGPPTASFFNYGLTLHETSERLLGGLSFKAQDARLGHTLSRDNVRRDRNFDRVMDTVRDIADKELPGALRVAVEEAALGGDLERYGQLLEAATRARLTIGRRELAVPLVESMGGRSCVSASEWIRGGGWAAFESSRLTAFLSAEGKPVLRLVDGLSDRVQAACGYEVQLAEAILTLATRAEASLDTTQLLESIAAALEAVYRRPTEVVLAELDGAQTVRTSVAGPAEPGRAWLVADGDVERSPFGLIRRLSLVLNTRSPAVAAALERAVNQPRVAASLLVRTILLEYDRLDEKRSLQLVESDLEELLG